MSTYTAPPIDLLSLIESRAPTRLVRKTRTHGGQYAGACPWCHGTNRFIVWPYREHPGYYCRVCGRTGGPVRFLMDYEHMTKEAALRELDLQDENHPLPSTSMTHNSAPLKKWQETGRGFVHAAMSCLWSTRGKSALRYLHGRGFTDETIREAELGYCPGLAMPGEKWGIQTKQLIIPRGIVMPWYYDGDLWKITLRLGKESPSRYTQILGSQECLYNADKITDKTTTVLYEGVFDALTGKLAAPDLAHVATDDAHKCRGARFIVKLCLAPAVLVAYDADEVGDRESLFWTRTLSKAIRWRPWAKDANDMLSQGLDVGMWLQMGNSSVHYEHKVLAPAQPEIELQNAVWEMAAKQGFPALPGHEVGEQAYLEQVCYSSPGELLHLKSALEAHGKRADSPF